MRIATRVTAIAGGTIVIGSLFLHWYENEVVVTGTRPHINALSGWAAFSGVDIAIAALAGAAVLLATWSLVTSERGTAMAIVAVLGMAAAGLTILQITSPPESANQVRELEDALDQVGIGALQSSVSVDVGAYVALAGSGILIFAAIAGALAPPTRRCPDCAKSVPLEAHICHHCGFRFAG